MDRNNLLITILSALFIPFLFLLYFYLTEKSASALHHKAKQKRLLALFWLLPVIAILVFFLIYPMINTIIISFMNANSTVFTGFSNYIYLLTDSSVLTALKNNLLWIFFFTLISITFGLVLAVLADKLRYEVAVKALIFLPACISLVAAGVIWKFMYTYRPAGTPQIGFLNAVLSGIIPGFKPRAWLFDTSFNNWALIIVGVWMWTGFALIIFSASLKGIPGEIIEAAEMDGAGRFIIFFRILLPLMSKTITVVITFFVITVLKIFDIVYVMTNGNLGTEVIANRMYKEMFSFRNFGKAGAIAVFLLAAVVPVVIINIRKFSGRQGKR